MKIALVHDHILEFGGAERVFVTLKKIFPDTDVYLAAYDSNVVKRWIPDFYSWNVHTSWVSKIPFYKKLYSPLRFLAPKIWESFDFSQYDLVISSSGWFMSKGVITNGKTKHISYIHHPPAYLYGYQTAMEWQKYWPIKIYAYFINHFLRVWDFNSSKRADILIANSEETKGRIKKFYRRDSHVIYPPVTIPDKIASGNKTYYVTLSRLAFKKHVDFIIKTANKMKWSLKVVGTGRDEEYLKSIAGPTVEFLSHLPDEKLADLYSGAKAFLNASEDEEFGIAPVEAMGYGVPVVAYASGGLKETVKENVNGYLFNELTEKSLNEKIKKLEQLSGKEYTAMSKNARKESEKYTEKQFKKRILEVVDSYSH